MILSAAAKALAMSTKLESAAAGGMTAWEWNELSSPDAHYQSLEKFFYVCAGLMVVRGLDKLTLSTEIMQFVERHLKSLYPNDVKWVLFVKTLVGSWWLFNWSVKKLFQMLFKNKKSVLATTWVVVLKVMWHLLGIYHSKSLLHFSGEFRCGVLNASIAAALVSSLVSTSICDLVGRAAHGGGFPFRDSPTFVKAFELALLYIGCAGLVFHVGALTNKQTVISLSMMAPALHSVLSMVAIVGQKGLAKYSANKNKAAPKKAALIPIQSLASAPTIAPVVSASAPATPSLDVVVDDASAMSLSLVTPAKRTRTPRVKGSPAVRSSERLRNKRMAAMQSP